MAKERVVSAQDSNAIHDLVEKYGTDLMVKLLKEVEKEKLLTELRIGVDYEINELRMAFSEVDMLLNKRQLITLIHRVKELTNYIKHCNKPQDKWVPDDDNPAWSEPINGYDDGLKDIPEFAPKRRK